MEDGKKEKENTHTRAHTERERERERERESCCYMYNPKEAIEKWLKDGQRVRRFNDESVRKRTLIVMGKDDDITAASAIGGGELDEDIEEMQEMEEDVECEESGTESDEGDEEEGKIEKILENVFKQSETVCFSFM